MDHALIIPVAIMSAGALVALALVSWRAPRVRLDGYANEWARRRGIK